MNEPASNPASAAPPAPVSPIEAAHDPYFVQKQYVGDELAGLTRLDVFRKLCAGKRVLHVGCVDWPITDLNHSLHLQLDGLCQLDGFDIHAEAFPRMLPYLKGRLFSRWEEVTDGYDLVLAPEVLEHVPDVQGFLRQLDGVNAPTFALTVPDAWSCMGRRFFDYGRQAQTFVEVVHPDHNCWYTPFTFANVLRKYTPWRLQGMWFFNAMSLLAIATR